MTLGEVAWSLAFLVSLAAVLFASERLVGAVEAAGDRYNWPAGLVGLLAAAGADGPEISSAFIALGAGAHAVSLGVILGSNLFNVAALLGLPVLLVGHIAVQRYGLLVNGAAMLGTTLLAAALILGALPLPVAELLTVALLTVYFALLFAPRQAVLAHAPAPLKPSPDMVGDAEYEERAREREADVSQGFPSGRSLLLTGLLATAVLIGGCDILVNATLYLGPRLGVPDALTGVFGLAILTSLPNVWVAVSLARRHRGAVLVSAVCNSNTINAVFGICVPAPFIALQPPPIVRNLDIPAVVVLTLLAVGLVWRGHGLRRSGAVSLVLAYLAFAAARLFLTVP